MSQNGVATMESLFGEEMAEWAMCLGMERVWWVSRFVYERNEEYFWSTQSLLREVVEKRG